MKAIKLASIFAVTAIAAAVSTTTIAAEPVFSGSAGLKYTGGEGKSDAVGSEGEVNIIGDTGVVYFDLDMGTGDSADEGDHFILDEIYVTQGAVQFGDFDGSLSDSAVMYGGVEEGEDASSDLGLTLGARYAVSDSLTVALESVDGGNDAFATAAFTQDFGALALTLSGAAGLTTEESATTFAAGVSVPLGMATVQAYVQSGSTDDTTDIGSMGLGVDLAISEALTVSAAMYDNTESDADDSITEITAYYTAGDLTYYATTLMYDVDASDYSIVGIKASF